MTETVEIQNNIYGLVLAGGQSTRMGEDKALIKYHQQTQLERSYNLLNDICENTFVSVSAANSHEATRQNFPLINDQYTFGGPLNGIASAFKLHPDKAWLIVACDLPLLDSVTLAYLIKHRDTTKDASAYISNYDQLPEPLCAIWESKINSRIQTAIAEKRNCPRKILIQANTHLLKQKKSAGLR